MKEMRDAPLTEKTRIETHLTVLDGTTQRPLAGARVLWAEMKAIQAFRASQGRLDSPQDEILEKIGRVAISNGWGQVDLGQRVEEAVVRGWHGELASEVAVLAFKLRGRLDLQGDSAFFTANESLLLYPDRALEIQVVDAAGKPRADVEVRLRTNIPPDMLRHAAYLEARKAALDTPGAPEPAIREPSAEGEIWRGTTAGELGSVRVEHVDALLRPLYDPLQRHDDLGFYADFVFPTRPSVAVKIDPWKWPAEPVRLVLPGTGSLTVVVLDRTGTPTRDRVKVYIDGVEPVDGQWTRVGEGDLDDGRIHIAPIHLGLSLSVNVSFYGRRDALRRSIEGPTAAQTDIELVIHETPPLPVLVGQLVGPSGPLAEGTATLEFWSKNHAGAVLALGNTPLPVDAEGRFELQLTTQVYEQGSCTLRFVAGELAATRELGKELGLLRIELGVVRLAR